MHIKVITTSFIDNPINFLNGLQKNNNLTGIFSLDFLPGAKIEWKHFQLLFSCPLLLYFTLPKNNNLGYRWSICADAKF